MASLSKLASHASKNLFSQQKFHQHVGRMILASASMRNLVTKNYFCAHIAQQSRFTPGKAITFVDMMTGVYEDPKYELDLKPIEFRDEQASAWATAGALVVLVALFWLGIVTAGYSLSWYSLFDSNSTFWRSDPHPFFKLDNGAEVYKTYNTMYLWAYPYGAADRNVRHFFYEELEHALHNNKE